MRYNTKQEIEDAIDLLSPPGDTIADTIEAKNISLQQFAMQMDLLENDICQLLDGSKEITVEIAKKLEEVLGVPTDFWITREQNYRKYLAEIEAAKKEHFN